MRHYVVFVLLLMAGVALAFADGVPQAKLIEPNHDHGTVFVGTKIEGKFYVENTGTVPFTITDAKPTCHCTTTVASKEELAPGARGEIAYDITLASVGKTVKTIRIVTDPPLPDQLIFSASVTFAPFIEADAKDLTVDVPQGEPVNLRIPLRIAEGVENIKVLGARTRSRGMEVSLEGASDVADYTLVVQSKDPLPAGKRPVMVELEFEKEEKGVQNLAVTINVLPAIEITPAPIVVSFELGKDEATLPVTFRSTKGIPFTIKSVVPKVCVIREVTLPKEPALEHSMSLTFVRPPGRASLRGFLTFDFGDDLGTQTIYTVFRQDLSATPSTPFVTQGAK